MLNVTSKYLSKMPDCDWITIQNIICKANKILFQYLKDFKLIPLPQIEHFKLSSLKYKTNPIITSSTVALKSSFVGFTLQKIDWVYESETKENFHTCLVNENGNRLLLKNFWMPSPSDFLDIFIESQLNSYNKNDKIQKTFILNNSKATKVSKIQFFANDKNLIKKFYLSDKNINLSELSYLFFITENLYTSTDLIEKLLLNNFVNFDKKRVLNSINFYPLDRLALINEFKF